MQKRFQSLKLLRKWLLASTMVTVSAIYLVEPIGNLKIINNPNLLEQLKSEKEDFLPEGPYLVEYQLSIEEERPELDYSKMVMVLATDVTIERAKKEYGGLRHLIEKLVDYEYCVSSFTNHPGYRIAGLWVLEPKNPEDLLNLKKVLSQYALGYAFNDGSGFISQSNFNINQHSLSAKSRSFI